MAKRDEIDWAQVGRNVRQARIIRGHSQEDFARKAGLSVSTLYHVEQGLAINYRSFLKICSAFETSVDSMTRRTQNILTESDDFLALRREDRLWTVEVESRSRVPEDDLSRIQQPEERLRLGRLGLVNVFFCTTNFIMPEGPGLVYLELYRRFTDPFNSIIYRDCLLTSIQGTARLMIGETVTEVRQGDVIGYRSKDLVWMEPLESVGKDDLPVILTWTGAVRVGSPPMEDYTNKRVRKRKRQGDSQEDS